MDKIISVLIELVVLVIVFLISRYVLPWLRANVNFEQLELVTNWAMTFVTSAEQIIKGEGLGEKKLEYASNALSDKVNELGIKISDADMRNIIEEAVKMMNDAKKGE